MNIKHYDEPAAADMADALFGAVVGTRSPKLDAAAALADALREFLAAGDNSMNPPNGDDVAAMLRFGVAHEAASAALARWDALQ
jgi:hypothetical protein